MPDYTYQQIVLRPGESFTLPAGATLIYSSNPTNLDSNCDIPTEFELKCWKLEWENQSNAPVEDADFIGVTIDGIFYPFSTNVPYDGNLGDDAATLLQDQMTLDLPQGIFVAVDVCDTGDDSTQSLIFQSVGSSLIFKIQNPTGVTTTYLYLIPEEIDNCEC